MNGHEQPSGDTSIFMSNAPLILIGQSGRFPNRGLFANAPSVRQRTDAVLHAAHIGAKHSHVPERGCRGSHAVLSRHARRASLPGISSEGKYVA
jgi:hypothetical protein